MTKAEADQKCIRCGHANEAHTGYMLTVHHLDLNKSNCRWWNLVALCQRCHLRIQGKVDMDQSWMFDFSDWIKPYVAGYYAHRHRLPDLKPWVLDHIDELIQMGTGYNDCLIIRDKLEGEI